MESRIRYVFQYFSEWYDCRKTRKVSNNINIKKLWDESVISSVTYYILHLGAIEFLGYCKYMLEKNPNLKYSPSIFPDIFFPIICCPAYESLHFGVSFESRWIVWSIVIILYHDTMHHYVLKYVTRQHNTAAKKILLYILGFSVFRMRENVAEARNS